MDNCEAYDEGWDDYMNKRSGYNNPYEFRTKEYQDYDDGWCAAESLDELDQYTNN